MADFPSSQVFLLEVVVSGVNYTFSQVEKMPLAETNPAHICQRIRRQLLRSASTCSGAWLGLVGPCEALWGLVRVDKLSAKSVKSRAYFKRQKKGGCLAKNKSSTIYFDSTSRQCSRVTQNLLSFLFGKFFAR